MQPTKEAATQRALCPICQSPPAAPLLTLDFSERKGLPSHIALNRCVPCDFAFTSPADREGYAAYYAQTRNDLIHDAISQARAAEWIAIQSASFCETLEGRNGLRILDYGCGGGDLIRKLATLYPKHHYVGFDLHPTGQSTANITFTDQLSGSKFDLIIFSHVLEHMVDLTELATIFMHLNDAGEVYIEVPNPAEYPHYPHREFLYYIDRLHINHFSLQALAKLTASQGMRVKRYGSLSLPYKDGERYPSHYIFAKKTAHSTAIDAITAYIDHERNKPNTLDKIDTATPILIYGFGDNFFRARSAGGPLDEKQIAAIIDQRAEMLKASPYAQDFNFLTLDHALKQFPDAPIVITVSWGAEQIADSIRAQDKNRQIFTL